MTNFTEDQEKIGRNKSRRKNRNMADTGNKEPQHQEPEEKHQEDETGDEDTPALTEMYLPYLHNTPLSQALKSGLDWGMEDEVMVECPKLKQYFRVDTLLIQRISGRVCLHTKDEDKTFPISCSKTKFPIPLLKKALEGAEQQRATPKDLPGEDWPQKIKTILGRMELDRRLDVYAELVGRYARYLVSLEHAHMVNRGSADGYYKVANYELWSRKISNRMDKIPAIVIQDNAYREQAKFKTYPIPTTNPVNQLITSLAEADKIADAAQREADNIMAIAFPSGAEPPLATTDSVTTQIAQSALHTAPLASTMTTATDCLDQGRQLRPTSPAFIMNAIPDNWRGPTTNPLLIVNTGQDGNTNSFITPTLVTNHQNRQGNRNTVAFENTIPETDKQINTRLVEIANQGPSLETAVTSHSDCHIPDRHQYTNHREHQYQGMYTNQNRSYTNNYNQNYRHTWENHTDRTCNNCGTKGHIAKYCTKTSFWCQWCHTTTHDTQACRSKPRSSTSMESPRAGSYHPTQSPNQHNTSNHQPLLAHTMQPSPAPSGGKEWAKLLVTHMEEQEYNNREIENRKTYLENIEVYEGTDKQKCLPWVNRLQQAAKCSNTSLRAALLARAGATVLGIVAATPENIDNLEMKKVVLRNFSDIATPTEAAQKLRNMRMTPDQPIASYNYNYAAVHEAAFDINPSEQRMRFALEDYANSLPEYTADKLSYKIAKVNSWIKTLQDAMDHAVKIDQESRQSEVMRNKRNNSGQLIDTTVNEISVLDINYVASRQGDSRFNSTMKPGYQRENKDFAPRNRQNDSFRNNRNWNSPRNNNPNFRKINKYKHHAREPRNNIKFEYSISRGEKEIMRTLRNMIDFLKGKTDKVVEDIKRMPKVNPRGVNEVSEDSIATISIEEIQRILKEDVNTVYDTLVASDYIEEITEA